MIRMIGYELKKMCSEKIFTGSLIVLLLICFGLIQVYGFNNPTNATLLPDGGTLYGRSAIRYNQHIAAQYAGEWNDSLTAQMLRDFSLQYPEEYADFIGRRIVQAKLPSSYAALAFLLPPENIADKNPRSVTPKLTSAGLMSVQEFNSQSLRYGYADSWYYFFQGFCGPNAAITWPLLIVITIVASTIFSREYSTKMDALILSARYGKNKLILAKMSALLILVTLLTGCVFVIFGLSFGIHYGLAGWDASIQTNVGLSLMHSEFAWNNLQLILVAFILVWLSGLFTATVAALASAITKTTFSSLVIALVFLMAPWIAKRFLASGLVNDLLLVFPANAINVQNVLLTAMRSGLGQPVGSIWIIMIVAIIGSIISTSIAFYCFRNHQVMG